MKKVRSSLNLDLDLSLSRAGAPAGVFALGLACLKARDDIRSPAGLAVSIGIISYTVLAAVLSLSGLQQSLAWAACCCRKRGLSIRFSACYCWESLQERNDNRTERGSVERALCVNQHPVALITHEHFCCNRELSGERQVARGKRRILPVGNTGLSSSPKPRALRLACWRAFATNCHE